MFRQTILCVVADESGKLAMSFSVVPDMRDVKLASVLGSGSLR
jgi:hypothetical protein